MSKDIESDQERKGAFYHPELMAFVAEMEVGSVEFTAFSDYVEQFEALLHLESARKNALKVRESQGFNDKTDLFLADSSLRVAEQRKALIDHDIYLGRSRVPGYEGAYVASFQLRERLFDNYFLPKFGGLATESLRMQLNYIRSDIEHR